MHFLLRIPDDELSWHYALLMLPIGYLIGSIPFAFLIAKAKGIDLRKFGSGNIGATNAARAMGLRWFFVIFPLDALKGWLAASIGIWWLYDITPTHYVKDLALIGGLGAVLGHTFPFWLKFKGGKAVATGVGFLAAIAPLAALICIGVFCVVLAITRYVSLGSIIAACAAPIVYWQWGEADAYPQRLEFLIMIGILITVLHHKNIRRLIAGTEHAVGRKKPAESPTSSALCVPALGLLPVAEMPVPPLVLIGGGALLLVMIVVIVIYNKCVRLRNLVKESFSDVDTELQRRHELIPGLVEIVKGYAKHEQEPFTKVTQARTRALEATTRFHDDRSESTRRELQGSERELGDLMSRMVIAAEAYPDLKASTNFQQLMRELSLTEDRIQAARRFFNANVRDYNSLCQSFPQMLVAKSFGFQEASYLELENPLARQAPQVSV